MDVLSQGENRAVTVGPVQLAGLGSGAASLLNQAGRSHRAGLATGRQH